MAQTIVNSLKDGLHRSRIGHGATFITHEPTIEDVDALSEASYYVWGNTVYVRAEKVDAVHVHYVCPFCFNRYKKNGEPYKRSKRHNHCHGSGGVMSNRFETRAPHCNYMNYGYVAQDGNIHQTTAHLAVGVTPSTKRV